MRTSTRVGAALGLLGAAAAGLYLMSGPSHYPTDTQGRPVATRPGHVPGPVVPAAPVVPQKSAEQLAAEAQAGFAAEAKAAGIEVSQAELDDELAPLGKNAGYNEILRNGSFSDATLGLAGWALNEGIDARAMPGKVGYTALDGGALSLELAGEGAMGPQLTDVYQAFFKEHPGLTEDAMTDAQKQELEGLYNAKLKELIDAFKVEYRDSHKDVDEKEFRSAVQMRAHEIIQPASAIRAKSELTTDLYPGEVVEVDVWHSKLESASSLTIVIGEGENALAIRGKSGAEGYETMTGAVTREYRAGTPVMVSFDSWPRNGQKARVDSIRKSAGTYENLETADDTLLGALTYARNALRAKDGNKLTDTYSPKHQAETGFIEDTTKAPEAAVFGQFEGDFRVLSMAVDGETATCNVQNYSRADPSKHEVYTFRMVDVLPGEPVAWRIDGVQPYVEQK